MKKQIMTLALALTIMGTGVSSVFACDCGCGCGCGCHPPMNPPQQIQKIKLTPEQKKEMFEKKIAKFENEIGLTAEQKVQAKEIRTKGFEKVKPLMEKKKAKINEIKQIRENDNITVKVQDKKIEAIRKELRTIDQEIRQVMQDDRKAFKAILTEEQVNKLEQMKMEHRCHHHKMHRRHHCPPRVMY